MKILLAPHGTRGDVQPMLALAEGLRHRGHTVCFSAPANFVAWIASRGFEARSNGIDVERLLQRPGADFQSLQWQLSHVRQVLVPQLFESVSAASDGMDLIVGAGVQLAGASVAEWREVPYCNVGFYPGAVPNSSVPPPFVKTQTLPRWANQILWQIGGPLARLALRAPLNAARRRLGLEPLDGSLSDLIGSRTIVAADRDLAPLGKHASPKAVQTDAWIDRPPASLEPRIEAFLELDPAPIYIGFGSMVAKDADALASAAITAARAIDRPAIVAGGWAGLDRRMYAADDICAVGDVPHDLVLPRVAVAVHHGGAGTTTAAARAGVPQLVLPHILDQFYWAHRVEALSLGPAGFPAAIVNAEVLTDRLAMALGDQRIHDSAAAFGARIAARSGVEAAVDILVSNFQPPRFS